MNNMKLTQKVIFIYLCIGGERESVHEERIKEK